MLLYSYEMNYFTNESVLLCSINKKEPAKSQKQNLILKNIKILFVFICLYFIAFFNIEKLERNITFPGVGKPVSNAIVTPKSIEEINIQIANGNNIHGDH